MLRVLRQCWGSDEMVLRQCWDIARYNWDAAESQLRQIWDIAEMERRHDWDTRGILFISWKKKSILWLSSVKSELACRYGMCILYSLMEPQLHIAITECRSSAHRSECKKSKTFNEQHDYAKKKLWTKKKYEQSYIWKSSVAWGPKCMYGMAGFAGPLKQLAA